MAFSQNLDPHWRPQKLATQLKVTIAEAEMSSEAAAADVTAERNKKFLIFLAVASFLVLGFIRPVLMGSVLKSANHADVKREMASLASEKMRLLGAQIAKIEKFKCVLPPLKTPSHL